MAEGETNAYFASDLMHRLYHMPAFGDGLVEHFTEGYTEVLALGADNATFAIRDSDVLQYFALDVYAFDIILPGVGCPGGNTTEVAAASESSTPTASETTAPNPTADVPPVSTIASKQSCASADK